jgi:hypothetical protein
MASDSSGTYDPGAPISVLGNAPMPAQWSVGGDASQPGVLAGALNQQAWTPADNSLQFFVDPDTLKTIDLSGDGGQGQVGPAAPDQGRQPDNDGFNGLTPYQPGPDAGSSVLNRHGYIPQDGDENQLARVIYAEASNTPSDMPAIGWSVVNRVGDPEFGKTMDAVVNQKNAFSSVQNNDPQWRGSADPDSLTGPNAAAWQKAQDTAQGILGGAIPDPTDGGAYFYSSPPDGTVPKGFKSMINEKKITPVSPPDASGINHFFKRNPS